MSTQFNPDGPVGVQLKHNLIQELKNRFNCGEDAVDIAEFIVILIVSGKSYQEILGEVKEIADIAIDLGFIETVFKEIERLQSQEQGHEQNQASAPSAAPVQQEQPQFQAQVQPQAPVQTIQTQFQSQVQAAQQMPAVQQPQFSAPPVQQPQVAFQNHPAFQNPPNGFFAPQATQAPQTDGPVTSTTSFSLPDVPTGPKNQRKRDFVKRGGIQKESGKFDKPKSFAMKNSANFAKVLNLPQNSTNFIQKAPKGRCADFPYCENKECEFSHPTKNCFAYPNCPNAPGTCNFLHPDQDQELIAKLAISREKFAKSREEFHERKNAEMLLSQASCKYGLKCAKDSCPFAHPTPANGAAKITTLDWCPQGKACIDTACFKAHPPPATAKAVKPQDQAEIALEQCKFGINCTNQKCPRRHATSFVPCRAGSSCRRLDCTFAHALNEECRFGIKCGNRNCMYQHPAGREVASNTWSSSGSRGGTANRVFVSDDQAVEQVVQQ